MPHEETAVVVHVPAAESAVGAWRARLDPSAGWGVPAHVTVLYPFLPPDRLDDAALAALAASVASVPAFDVTFSRVAWFGENVVWLAPDPDLGFRTLTAAVWQQFPETPPYGGIHDDVIPHLTIGDGAPLPLLREAEADVRTHLPIASRVDGVHVMQGAAQPDSWRTIAHFPLGVLPS